MASATFKGLGYDAAAYITDLRAQTVSEQAFRKELISLTDASEEAAQAIPFEDNTVVYLTAHERKALLATLRANPELVERVKKFAALDEPDENEHLPATPELERLALIIGSSVTHFELRRREGHAYEPLHTGNYSEARETFPYTLSPKLSKAFPVATLLAFELCSKLQAQHMKTLLQSSTKLETLSFAGSRYVKKELNPTNLAKWEKEIVEGLSDVTALKKLDLGVLPIDPSKQELADLKKVCQDKGIELTFEGFAVELIDDTPAPSRKRAAATQGEEARRVYARRSTSDIEDELGLGLNRGQSERPGARRQRDSSDVEAEPDLEVGNGDDE
ncbi:hypothetical protein JCM8547_004580 [Rhodosporidiobolus lusitaniae]